MATLFPNAVARVQTFYGLLKIGAVSVVLNNRLGAEELHDLLDRSDATALIYHQKFTGPVHLLRSRLPRIEHHIFGCG